MSDDGLTRSDIKHIFKTTFISVFVSVAIYSVAYQLFESLRSTAGFVISFLIPFFVAPVSSYVMVKSRRKIENLAAELARQSEKAKEASKAKDAFIASMSHELRTPLTHIIGFSELLLYRKKLDDSKKAEYLTNILNSSSHLLSLVDSILDLSILTADKIELNKEAIDIIPFFQEFLDLFTGDAEKKEVSFSVEFGDISGTLFADRIRLKQIMYNILSNAVKFTDSGGRISVKLYSSLNSGHNSVLNIVVEDTGIGISKNDLTKIFNIFEQADDGKNHYYRGAGVGLSLAKQLTDLHGGTLLADSRGIGKGSRFHLMLPQAGIDS